MRLTRCDSQPVFHPGANVLLFSSSAWVVTLFFLQGLIVAPAPSQMPTVNPTRDGRCMPTSKHAPPSLRIRREMQSVSGRSTSKLLSISYRHPVHRGLICGHAYLARGPKTSWNP